MHCVVAGSETNHPNCSYEGLLLSAHYTCVNQKHLLCFIKSKVVIFVLTIGENASMDLCVLKIALWGSTTYQVGGDPITADSDPSPVVIAVCSTFVKNYQVWQENHPLLQCNPECTPTSAYLQSVKYEKGDAIATVVAGRGTPSVKTKFSTVSISNYI
ncbi:hypothetical protein MKX01_040041 [Papaver californicum]|nr:hypothetical protein MKX01_040041 [Papaver californicum]